MLAVHTFGLRSILSTWLPFRTLPLPLSTAGTLSLTELCAHQPVGVLDSLGAGHCAAASALLL